MPRQRSYPQGVALIPKPTIDSKRTAQIAVVVSLIGLAVIPVITVPAMLVAGVSWRGAPRWARITLLVGAVVFAFYLVAARPTAPIAPHG